MVLFIILPILLFFYARSAGISEARYFAPFSDKKINFPQTGNLYYTMRQQTHYYFEVIRWCVYVLVMISLYLFFVHSLAWWIAGLFAIFTTVCLYGSFMLYHDGYLYKQWNWLDSDAFPLGFKDNGDGQSSTNNNYPYNQRKLFAIIGYLLYLFAVIVSNFIVFNSTI